MFLLALQAAAWRVPFLPTRVGLGSDLMKLNTLLRTVRSPFDGRQELVAVPAMKLDAAICHLNRADVSGNATFLGPDLYFDDLFLRAAPTRRFISVERIVPTSDLAGEAGTELRLRVARMMVDGVVERAGGALFTSCVPDYERDEGLQKEYADAARSPDAWAAFKQGWIDSSEEDFQRKVAAR
jgi:glutaconate CoA-transferase, subunit A